MEDLISYITVTIFSVNTTSHLLHDRDYKMNGDKKFNGIYVKFGGSYSKFIEKHLRLLKEFEKCRQIQNNQTCKK